MKYKKSILSTLIAITVIIGIWSSFNLVDKHELIPNISEIAKGSFQNILTEKYWFQLTKSLIRIALATFFSLSIALVVAFIQAQKSIFSETLNKINAILFLVPPIIVTYLLIIITSSASEFVIIATSVFTVVPQISDFITNGFKSINKDYKKISIAFKLPRNIVFKRIFLPQFLPTLASAIKVSFFISWKIVILAESMIANNGIGYMVSYYFRLFSINDLMHWLVPTIIIMFLIEKLINLILRQNFKHQKYDLL